MAGNLYILLIADLASALVPLQWRISGVYQDIGDWAFAGIAFGLARRKGAWRSLRQLPFVRAWLLLGGVTSLAYLSVPINAHHLTSFPAVSYQLYRYCWKPILFYPLAFLLLRDPRKLRTLLVAAIVAADACALLAMTQGYSGQRATGPLRTHNELGGVLIVPFVLALSGVLSTDSRIPRLCYLASTLLIGRALIFAGSRGALVSVVVGSIALLSGFLSTHSTRSRLLRLGGAALLLALLVIAAKGDVFERPNVRRLLTVVTEGAQVENLQWRTRERWPHFWSMLVESPWVGAGTEVDPSLGPSANTPHNGYLAIAMKSGIPALALFMIFPVAAVRQGLWAFRRSHTTPDGILGLTTAAGTIGLLVHNIVDATFLMPFGQKVFWLLVAISAFGYRRPEALPARGAVVQRNRLRLAPSRPVSVPP